MDTELSYISDKKGTYKGEGIRHFLKDRIFINPLVRAEATNEIPTHVLLSDRKFARLYKIDFEGAELVVKIIFRQKAADYVRAYFKNQAKREYHSALELRKIGLKTLVPVNYFVNLNLFSPVDSVFVCEFVTDAKTGSEFMAEPEMRGEFWRKFVADCRKMLDAGVISKDAHPGNVMWSGSSDEALVWIDNDVKRFSPSRRSEIKQEFLKRLKRKQLNLTAEELAVVEGL